MENNFDLEYLESLYESLDVSDGAKSRFFEAFLKEAQAEANPNAKKAGLIHKFLAWLNKGTPTVESSAQTILGALAGMERIIQTSPLIANDEARGQRDIQYLAKYKAQIEKATQGIIDAQAKYKEAQDRFFQSNPQVQNAQAQLNQAAEAEAQELEGFQKRIEGANGNPEELQKIKTELEQKLQEVKAQSGNDEDAGGEYEEEIRKIDELLAANPTEDTSDQEENPEAGAQPEGEEAPAEGEANAEEPAKDETAEKVEKNEKGETGGVKDLNDSEEQDRFGESTKK
jgi:chromosome segregation ATPase